MLFTSPLPDIELPRTNVFDMVFGPVSDTSRPAITEIDTGRSTTYTELRQRAERVAAELVARGVGRGDVVVLRLPNSIDFAAGVLGIARSGAAAALLSPLLTEREAAELTALAGASAELTGADIAGATATAAADTSANAPTNTSAPAPEDLAVIAFSSGTTGLPKAVELTHSAVTANAAQFAAALAASGVQPGRRVAAPLPFSHIYGLNTLLLSSLAAGHHVHTAARFDIAQFADAHARHGIELSFIAPPIALALAKNEDIDADAFAASRWMVCGAAPLDEGLARAVERRLGTTILQGYGTTESAPVTHVGIAGRSNPGSIGYAVPNTQFRVVEPGTLADAAPGQPGELVVRGPQLMRGYRGDRAATERSLIHGWLRTGDLARARPDGSVWIIDRVKEVIKYRGYQVPPAELEALLLTHPGVRDAAVVGVRRAADGEEVPKAFVVAKEASTSKEALMAWVAERVAPYKKIRDVEFVGAIPRNAAGKILRRELR